MKNFISNKSKFIKVLTLVIMMITSVFALVGCSLTNPDQEEANASYDSSGNPRITSLSVDYAPFSISDDGRSQIIDGNSGVFSFVLPYYFNGNLEFLQEAMESAGYNLGDEFAYDQNSLGMNYFVDKELKTKCTYARTYAPFYASSNAELQSYFTDEKFEEYGIDAGSTLNKTVTFNGEGFYSVINKTFFTQDSTAYTSYTVARVYTYASTLVDVVNSLDASFPSGFQINDFFAFPDLLFVVDGQNVEVRVSVNFDNIVLNPANTNTLLEEINPTETFTFKYQKTNPATNVTTWEIAPASMISYYFDEDAGFVIKFNPRLQEGSTTRTLKVKALSNTADTSGVRGNSNFSNNIKYNAYKLEFKAYSVNSTTIDYLGLSYNTEDELENAFYFANVDTVFSSILNKEVVTKLTGYFPEGRQVTVSRNVDMSDGMSYAHQPWTTNEHAENTMFLSRLYSDATAIAPNNLAFNSFSSAINFADQNSVKAYIKTLFETKALRENDGFYVVTPRNSSAENIVHFKPTADVPYEKLFNLFFEDTTLVHDSTLVSNTITVTSCNQTSNYKFYANFAKVQNFVMSGNIHDGDLFFTSQNSALSGVTVGVYDSNGTRLAEVSPLENYTKTGFERIQITVAGNEFSVCGLSHTENVIFQKLHEEQSGGFTKTLPYEFYSATMTATNAGSNATQKCLTAKKNETTFTDKINNTIIGTKFENSTNLVVNVYTQNDAGFGNQLVGDGNATGVEIIKSTSSTVDENGYVTTNVIISVSVPSNSTLIGYNMQSFQESKKTLYISNGNGMILHVSLFDNEEGKYVDEIFYHTDGATPVNSSSVTKSADGRFYLYEGQAYAFDSMADETTSNYQLVTEGNLFEQDVIKSLIVTKSGGTETYSLITYSKAPSAYFVVANDPSIDDSNNDEPQDYTIAVDYDGHKFFKTSSSNNGEVHVFAEAYQTELKYVSEAHNETQGDIDFSVTTAGTGPQSVYVYYDTKVYEGNGNRYLTAPIGKKLLVTDVSVNAYTWYYGNFSNTEDLLNAKKILSGSDILSAAYDANEDVRAFRALIGAQIISYCYYYILPLGNAEKIHVSQTIGTVQSTETKVIGIPQYKLNGNIYNGDILTSSDLKNATADFTVSTPSGEFSLGGDISFKIENNQVKVSLIDPNTNHETSTTLTNYLKDKYNVQIRNNGFIYDAKNNSYGLNSTDYSYTENYEYHVAGHYQAPNITTGAKPVSVKTYILAVEIKDGRLTSNVQEVVQIGNNYYLTKDITYVSQIPLLGENGSVVGYFSSLSEINEHYSLESNESDENYGKYYQITINNQTFKTYEDLAAAGYTFVRDMGNQNVGEYEKDGNYYTAEKRYYTTDINQMRTLIKLNGEATPCTSSIGSNMFVFHTFKVKNDDNTTVSAYDYELSITDGGTVYHHPLTYITPDLNHGEIYKTPDGQQLTVEITFAKTPLTLDVLMREAKLASGGTQIYLMGKYIMTNNSDPIAYPAFSNILATGEFSAIDLANDAPTYSLDYTNTQNVVEGFPGVRLLAGAPYANPILTLQIRHKASELAGVNLALDIKQAYYVELMTTIIPTEGTNLIQDFSTVAFKDTLTNISQNDYIDNIYQLLSAEDFDLVEAYRKNADGSYSSWLTDAKGQIVPLTVQEVGINDNDPYLYFADSLAADGKYKNKVYLYDALTDTFFAAKYGTHVIIWETSPTKLEDVPYFDIHSYTQGLDGLIYFNSGMLDDANSNCIGLEGIVGGATADSSYGFDYTEVLLGGTTSAYRTTTEFASQSENKYGYFVDKQIGTVTPYDSKDAYFLTGKESAVIVADPVVNIKDESLGESYIYRFKEWLVYSRYNSEILYYNRGMTESLLDRYDAILRFAATEAGYYVILPVYERVYTLSLGSEVENGAANIGGSVSVNYGGGEAVDISGAQNQTPLYFTQFHETTENDKTGYFYDNITTSGFLFFTGVFTTEGHPVFKTQQELKAENKQIVALRETKLVSTGFLEFKEVDYFNYYLLTLDSNGKVTEKTQLPTLTEKLKIGEAGIVELVQKEGANGTYWLTVYNTLNVEKDHEGNIVFDGNGNPKGTENTPVAKSATHGYDIDGVLLSDLLFLSHITAYYYDGIASDVQIYDQDKLNLIEAIETWLFHDQENISVLTRVNAHGETEFYAVFEDKYAKILDTDASSSFDKLLLTYGKHFATSFTNDFAPIRVIKNNPYVGGSRVNTSGSLASGELAYEMITDENGNLTQALSPTLNYKTSYYDRDTTITLTASPDEGYVLDGWKIGVYDNQTNRFVLKDESYAEEFEYTDLIIAASYNQTRGTYYYITEYFTVQNDEKVYFMDEEKTVQATVPATMLNSVRGTFVNDGTLDNPNYVQVHLRGTDGKYYYDQSFTKPVSDYAPFKDEQGNDVLREFVEMPFVDAVRSTYRESDANGNLIDSENGIYYLSNQLIFFHEGNFYRSRSNGNITITGNTVEIKRFHSNMRFVAVFKELYNTYIFAEPDTESGVRVIGAYYYNTDASTHGSDIRYDYTGTVRTTLEGAKDFVLTGTNVFAQGTNYSLIANAKKDNDGKMSTDLTTRLDSIYTSTFTSADGTLDKYTIRSNEVHALFGGGNGNTALPGVGDNTPLYRISDGLRGDDLKDLALSLEDYYFAEDTVMYFVVSVESSFDLNIHSLGADPKWVLSPILAPTKEYVKFNQENPDDSSSGSDYLFYVFKMTYNRDLTEENASLLNQSNRGVSLVSDLLSGRENDFYNNYFDLYDNFGNKLVQSTDVQDNDWKVSFAKNKETYTLSKSYVEKILKTLTNENGIRIFTDARASELANEFAGTVAEGEQNYQTKNPSNSLRNAFEVLCDFVYMPKAAFVSGVKYSPAYQTYIKDHAEGVADSKKFFSKALPGYYGEITNEDGTITKTEFPLIQAYFDIFDALTWLSREKTGSEIDPDNPSDLETPLFDHGGPWFAGSNNFINLSSIIVYTFSVETVTLDGYDTDGNPITNTNAYHNLLGKFYTAQGINDTRYIGSGEERDLNADAFTYPNEYSGTTFTQYVDTGIDPSERHIHPTVITSDKYKFQNTLTAIRYEDFLLAENSLMLLEGAEDAKDGYAFVGWFEQKFEEKPIARDENGDLEIDANGNYIYAEEGAWGEFSLVSTSLKRPYVAISNADTKIVALYKRVVDVSYTYDPTEVAVSLSVAKDDLGRDLSYTAVYSNGSETRITDPSEVFDAKIRVQGSFFFDSNVTVTVAPVGGFRLDTIDYSIFNENVLVGSSDFLENYTLPDADDIKLGKVFNTPSITRTAPINGVDGLSFMISQKDPDGNPVRDQNQKLITTQSYNKTATQNISFNLFDHLTFADKNDVSELAKTTEDINNDSEITYDDYCSNLLDIDFEIKAKAVKIVYVEVGNYNHETNQNFAFALIGADVDANQNPIQNTAKVYATITPKDVDLGHTLALDDAAHMAVSNYDLSTDTATFAIYIDADTLASKAFFVSTLKKSSVIGTEADTQAASVWYINGYATETTTIPAFANGADLHTDAHLFDAELSFDAYSSFDLFKISFAYDGDYEYLNNADFFDLSQNNSIYYLFGRIVENFTITVSHAFVNNVADLDEVDHDGGKLHIMNNASSTVIYRGAYYESGNISGNGYMLVTGQKSMLFSSDTLFDLTVSSLFEVVDGKLYMFVGWFEIVTNAGESKSVYSISLDGKKITENGSALNQNQSISSLEATSSGSVFEARYVLVNKLDLVPQTHGEIVADASNTVVLGNISTNDETGEIFGDLSYSFTALSNYNGDNLDLDGRTIVSGERLVMNGANVKLHATPADGYIFSAFKIGDFNDEHMTHPDAEIPYFDEAITKVDGTYSYILTVGGTGIEVDDTKAVAVFEQGIKINVEQQLFDTYQSALESTTTGTKYTTETYVYISYEHNGENYAQHGFMTSATVASNSMFKIEFILPDDNQNFTFVGFFVDGTLVSFDEASQIFENYYEDIITRDLMIEARFVRNAKVNVLAKDGNNSILNNAAFEISYTDFKTGQTVSGEFASNTFDRHLPSGTVLSINDVTNFGSNSFNVFTEFKQDTLSISKNKHIQSTVVATSQNKTINYISSYAKGLKVNLSKIVNLHNFDEDKQSSNIFDSYFDMSVTYMDIHGKTVTQNFGSRDEFTVVVNVNSSAPKTLQIKVSISDAVKERYTLRDVTYDYVLGSDETDSHEHTFNVTLDGTNLKNNHTLTVTFDPINSVVVSRVVNDKEFSGSENPNVTDGTNTIESDNSSMIIVVADKAQITLTAEAGASHIEFVGWFVDGTLKGTDTTLTLSEIKTSSRVVAKFNSLATLTISRKINDEEIGNADINLPLYFAGNIKNDSGAISLGSFKLENAKSTETISVVSGTEGFAVATHLAGYEFVGWTLSVGTTTTELSPVGGTGLEMTSKIEGLTAGASYTLTALYETQNTVNYVSTVLGQTEGDTLPSISGNAFYSSSDSSLALTTTPADGYALRKVIVTYFDSDGTKHSFINPTLDTVSLSDEIKGHNIVVEGVFGKQMFITVRVAVEESNDKLALESFGITDSNRANITAFSQNGTAYTFQDILNPYTETYMINLDGVFAGDIVSLSASDFKIGILKDYYFNGYYVFDSENLSIPSSVSAYSYDDSYSFVANQNMQIVLKYDQNQTSYANTTTITGVALTVDGTINLGSQTNGGFGGLTQDEQNPDIFHFGTKTLVFLGYVQEIKNNLRPSTFVLVSDNHAQDISQCGLTSAVAVFAEAQTVSVNAEIAGANSFSLVSSIKASSKGLTPVLNSNGKITTFFRLIEIEDSRFAFLGSNSKAKLTFTAKTHYAYYDESGNDINSCTVDLDELTTALSDHRQTVKVTVKAQNDRVTDVTAQISSAPQIQTLSIEIIEEDSNIVVDGGTQTVQIVLDTNRANGQNFTVTVDGTTHTFPATLTVKNNATLWLKIEEITNVSSQIFKGYTLLAEDGTEIITVSDKLAELYLSNLDLSGKGTLTLKAVFDAKFTLSVSDDSNFENGTITATNIGENILDITANPNSYIKDILVKNADGRFTSIWQNNTVVVDGTYISSSSQKYSSNTGMSGKTLFTKLTLGLTLLQNTTVKVVLQEYFTLNVEHWIDSSLKTVLGYYITDQTSFNFDLLKNTTSSSIDTNDESFVGFFFEGTMLARNNSNSFNFERSTIVQAKFVTKLDISIETKTNGELGSSVAGINVVKNTNTANPLITGVGTATAEDISINGQTFLHAFDNGYVSQGSKNSFYEFAGWFINDGTEDVCISENAVLVINQTFANAIKHTIQDGNGNDVTAYHTVVAVFNEITRTTIVETDYGSDENDIKFNVQGIDATTTKTLVDQTDYKISVQLVMPEDADQYVLEITYPIAATFVNESTDTFTVTASNFTQKDIPSGIDELGNTIYTTYYDYYDESDAQYYRFKNYKTNEGIISNYDEYDRAVILNFSSSNRTITASAAKLYTIELMTNFAHDLIDLRISTINTETGEKVTVASITNITTSLKPQEDGSIDSIKSFMFEAGQTVQVEVDYLEYAKQHGTSSTYHPFNTLAYSVDPNNELVKVFTDFYNDETIDPKYSLNSAPLNTKEFWMETFEGMQPVSQIDAFTQTSGTQTENLSTYNFAVTNNTYFIADFLDAFGDLRYYINAAISTVAPNSNFTPSTGSDTDIIKQEDAVNHHFNFGFVLTKTENEVTHTKGNYSDSPEIGDDSSYIIHVFDPQEDDDENFENDSFSVTSTNGQNSYHVSERMYTKINLQVGIVNKDTTKLSSLWSYPSDADFLKTAFGAPITKGNDPIYVNSTAGAAAYYKFGDQVKIVAQDITSLGYFFKGFIVLQSTRQNQILASHDTRANDVQTKTLTTYANIPYETSEINGISYNVATFKAEGNMNVVALYEPKTFVVEVKVLEYDLNAQEGQRLTDKASHSGKVRGSLIAEQGKPLALSAMNYNFAQFYGWTSNIEIGAYFASGDLIHESNYATSTNLEEYYDAFKHPENFPSAVYEMLDRSTAEKITLIHEIIERYDEVAETYLPLHQKLEELYGKGLVLQNKINDFVLYYQKTLKFDDRVYKDDANPDESQLSPTLDASPMTTSLNRLSLYAFNNIYMPTITDGLVLSAYYAPLQYTVQINITEVMTGFNYDAADGVGATDAYITYSDAYVEKYKSEHGGVWENPSYGYNGVEKDSIYVYTVYDNTGKIIAADADHSDTIDDEEIYPTKVMTQSIATEQSIAAGILLLKNKTIADGELFPLIPATTENRIKFTSAEAARDSEHTTLVEYITKTDEETGLEIKIDPFATDHANKMLSSVYDFIEKKDGKYRFINDQFISLRVGRTPFSANQLELKYDSETGQLCVVHTVTAASSGFPVVNLTVYDQSYAIKYAGFDFVNYDDKVDGRGTNLPSPHCSNFIQGFFNKLRTNIEDTSSTLALRDFEINLKFQYAANEVIAELHYQNSDKNGDLQTGDGNFDNKPSTLYLTGKNSADHTYVPGFTFSRQNETDMNLWNDEKHPGYRDMLARESVKTYNLFIVRQGRYIIDLLKQIIDKDKTPSVQQKAMLYMAYIYGFSPEGSLDNYYVEATGKHYIFSKESSDLMYNSETFISFLNSMSSITGVSFPLSTPGFLEFSKVDALNLYKAGVNHNYMSSFMNNGDAVVMSSKLNELAMGQVNTSTLGNGYCMWGEKPYLYYTSSSLAWGYKVETGAYSGTTVATEYANMAEVYANDGKTISEWNELDNYLAGIYNGSQDYGGNYYNRVSGCIVPSNEQFNGDIEATRAQMTIVNNIRMVSKELDWVQTPAAYYIAEGVMIIVEVAISIFTGGAGLVGKALLKYIIKTAVKGLGKSFMKHAAIHIAANLVSMALTGDDIMTNIGNIQFVPHPTSVTVPTQSPAGT